MSYKPCCLLSMIKYASEKKHSPVSSSLFTYSLISSHQADFTMLRRRANLLQFFVFPFLFVVRNLRCSSSSCYRRFFGFVIFMLFVLSSFLICSFLVQFLIMIYFYLFLFSNLYLNTNIRHLAHTVNSISTTTTRSNPFNQ